MMLQRRILDWLIESVRMTSPPVLPPSHPSNLVSSLNELNYYHRCLQWQLGQELLPLVERSARVFARLFSGW